MNHSSMKSRSALSLYSMLAGAALAVILAGCSTMANPNPALDHARADYRALQADPQVALLAPAELTQAGEALRTADTAWTQRENVRTVDHLTYLAQQRIAIARETTNSKLWEKATVATKNASNTDGARADADKAARDLSLAQRNAQEKSIELAVTRADAQHDKSRASDLEVQLKELNARHTERGNVITLDDVQFDPNRAELRAGGLRDMAKLLDFFKRYPKRTALIEGFTDNQGSEIDNLNLSQRRAGAVRDALIDHGVLADRLTIRGHGEAYPTSTNMTKAGRKANRRVEIVLSGEDGIVRAAR